ncbi:LysR family transcriptional regulator [Microvirga sp. BT350]|uniref:LysR family transcriptional regulator n=2 Tax=Microvirga alba TaxID=2791025 RepID=A0A931FQ19_9HYPH|nr:LysR family transcriptional regulator [Microvirga alba]
MNLHLLRLFAAVAAHRSFSRAAEMLNISQPAVSKGIREFEAQLGSPLFERRSGDVKLSEAGNVLIEHARVLFAIERVAEEALDSLHGLQRGTLRIGASKTVATYFLPPVLGAFFKAYPKIELRLTSANTANVVSLLVKRELDVALVEGPVEMEGIVVTPWRNDELILIAAAKHPLATKRGPHSLQALAGETIVLREEGSGTRDVAWEALETAGFRPSMLLEVSDNEALTRVVAAGLGIGIVSSVVAADQIALGRLTQIKIRSLTIRRALSRLSLPGRQPSPATLAFNSYLTNSELR